MVVTVCRSGLLIGREGAVLKQLREALGCRIVVTGAVSHQCELGAFEQFSTRAVLEPPSPWTTTGTRCPPPPSAGPPPEFEVQVSLNRPPR